MVKRTPFLT